MRLRLLVLAALAATAAGVPFAAPAVAAARPPARALAGSCTGLPKHTAIPVVDAANVVKPEALAYLAADLIRFHLTGNEAIVAATVPDLGGDDVASYAHRLFDCWGVGDADSDNGVLILVAMREHRIRIELGAGLEERVSESDLEKALDKMVAPMRRGDVGGALRAAAVSVAASLGSELPDTQHNPTAGLPGSRPTVAPSAPGDVTDVTDGTGDSGTSFPDSVEIPTGSSPFGDDSPGSGFAALVPFVLVIGLVGTLLRAVFRGGSSSGHSTWRGGFPGSGYGSGMWGSGMWGSGMWGSGSLFRGGGWQDSDSSSSSFGSGSSGGGFGSSSSGGSSSSSSGGSFGGGSSGGGGASGSW